MTEVAERSGVGAGGMPGRAGIGRAGWRGRWTGRTAPRRAAHQVPGEVEALVCRSRADDRGGCGAPGRRVGRRGITRCRRRPRCTGSRRATP